MNKKMDKRYFILIPLLALCVIGILSGNVFSLGHNKDKGGPGGSALDCNECHDFLNGIYGGGGVYGNPPPPLPPEGFNLRWVKTTIRGETVNFKTFNSFADGVAPYDGSCEVCHTSTKYYRKDSGGQTHYSGNCTVCHPHFLDDINNYFEPRFVGNQAHFTHFNDPKGPMLGTSSCTYNLGGCHNPSNYSKFGSENAPLSSTTVCNACHSQNGAFNGVGNLGTCSVTTSRVCNEDIDCPGETCNIDANSVAYGAKANWEHAIYEDPTDPDVWPSELKDGKENWCAGCHDNGLWNNGDSVVKNVHAPNVMGNNVAFGYNITGHGRDPFSYIRCDDCHDLTAVHTDGNARTYSASLNNYASGYRLSEGMAIPRNLQWGVNAFRLCFNCHIYSDVFGPSSDFRNGDTSLHDTHVGELYRNMIAWDSDWDGIGCSTGACADSAMSCTACHNVHGSPCIIGSSIVTCEDPLKTPMIRHGELISTPGTQDKVPALKFQWYDAINNPTTDFDSSGGGGLLCGNPYDVSFNDVCWGCHQYSGEIKYYRFATVQDVWATDTSNAPKPTFYPGDTIRYHVRFTISGLNQPYFVQDQGVVQKADGTGPKQTFSRSQTLTRGTYEWTEDRVIPSTITLPPEGITVRLTITVGSFSYQGGTLLGHDMKDALFFVKPSP